MDKVLIGICTGGSMQMQTVVSLFDLMTVNKNIEMMISAQVGGYVTANRNAIVKVAQDQKATHILYIDSDMVFSSDSIVRLLAHNKDIVGVNYLMRPAINTSGPISTVKLINKKGVQVAGTSRDIPDKLFEVYACGTGFMLIKTSVFNKFTRPYFKTREEEDGEFYTEDFEFCGRARLAGYDVWCDPTIRVGHIASITI